MARTLAAVARSLSPAQARRIALAAQGFHRPRVPARVDRRHLRRMLRAHPAAPDRQRQRAACARTTCPAGRAWAAIDRPCWTRMAFRHRELFEYWGHEASLLPVDAAPAAAVADEAAPSEKFETWGRLARLAPRAPGLRRPTSCPVVRDRGPLTAGELAAEERRANGGLGLELVRREDARWSTCSGPAGSRRASGGTSSGSTTSPSGSCRRPCSTCRRRRRRRRTGRCCCCAARACGVGTAGDLADYFRIRTPQARPRLAELVEAGELEVVQVARLAAPGLCRRRCGRAAPGAGARPARAVRPADLGARPHGAAVRVPLPGGDLRPCRAAGARLLRAAVPPRRHPRRPGRPQERPAGRRTPRCRRRHAEPGAPAHTAEALAPSCAALAAWLGLDDVATVDRGELAPALRAALRA